MRKIGTLLTLFVFLVANFFSPFSFVLAEDDFGVDEFSIEKSSELESMSEDVLGEDSEGSLETEEEVVENQILENEIISEDDTQVEDIEENSTDESSNEGVVEDIAGEEILDNGDNSEGSTIDDLDSETDSSEDIIDDIIEGEGIKMDQGSEEGGEDKGNVDSDDKGSEVVVDEVEDGEISEGGESAEPRVDEKSENTDGSDNGIVESDGENGGMVEKDDKSFVEKIIDGIIDTVFGNDVDKELSKARESLNQEEIKGEETYNGVKVAVNAPVETFPANTKLKIIPIKQDNDLEDIKNKISETEPVSDEVVAFDISFLYTLKSGEEVELQPLEGKTVEVSFDYTDNDELKKADNVTDEQLKIFHVKDKDEEGNFIEGQDQIAESVIINLNKTTDGEIVVDVADFSTYAIIKSSLTNQISITYNARDGRFSGNQQTLTITYSKNNGNYIANQRSQQPELSGNMFVGWYTNTNLTTRWYGITSDTTATNITVYAKYLPFEDKSVVWSGVSFTLMDRNMGASEAISGYTYGTTYSTTNNIGLYYQWGNNFGFSNTLTNVSTATVDNTSLERGPGNYYSNGIFISRSNSPKRWDTVDHRNLWGGSGESISVWNLDKDKQGPCPAGYHVPGTYEWLAVTNLFHKWQITQEGIAYCKSIHTTDTGEQFCMLAALGMPFGGHRSVSASTGGSLSSVGESAYYWSATAVDGDNAYSTYVKKSDQFDTQYAGSARARALSVRCFKDSDTLTLSFDSNGGSSVTAQTNFKRWNPRTTKPTNPIRENSSFLGWYLDENLTQPFTFSDTTYLSENTTLHAKWKCAEGYTESGDGNSCGKGIEYIDTEGNIFEMGTITYDDGTTSFTILDRNLGARASGTGCESNGTACEGGDSTYGYFFQWGNNYGFSNAGDFTISSTQVNASNYSWTNPYVSSTFVKGTNWATSNSVVNLWGNTTNQDYARQGPCPAGYHVPSQSEIQTLKSVLDDAYNGDLPTFRAYFALPFDGSIGGSDASVFGMGNDSSLWASTPYSTTSAQSWYFDYSMNNNYSEVKQGNRANAYPVRCFKDSQASLDSTVLLSFDTNGGQKMQGQRVPRNGTAHTPGYDPEKTGLIFQGWYENTNLTEPFDFTERLTSDTTVYAKWGCAEGYVLSEDGQSCERESTEPVITFDANGGQFQGGDTKKYVYPVAKEYYAHTDNINDDGTYTANYSRYYSGTNTITIIGASKLEIDITYKTYNNNDYIEIRKNNATQTKDANGASIGNSQGRLRGAGGNAQYVLTGNTVSFRFTNNTTSNTESYGYYAVVNGLDGNGNLIKEYKESDFSSIPTPTKDNMIFNGWYFDNGTFQNAYNFNNISIDENKVLYAKWGCADGYVIGADGQSCDQPKVTFDANGGQFQGGDTKKYVYPVAEEYYAHTDNIRDDGTVNGNYGQYYSGTNTITITGVSKLKIDITYRTYASDSYGKSDYVEIYKGTIKQTIDANGNTIGFQIGSNSGRLGGATTGNVQYELTGNTVGFKFTNRTDSNTQSYGYYAVVKGLDVNGNLIKEYKKSDFTSIPTPTKSKAIFDGWYLDNGTFEIPFDSSDVNVNQNIVVYAKWLEEGTLTIGIDNVDSPTLISTGVSPEGATVTQSFDKMFWVEDLKGSNLGYYTTISISDMTGTVSGIMYTIPKENIYLKGGTISTLSGSNNTNVVMNPDLTDYVSIGEEVTFIKRESGATGGIKGKYGITPSIKINIPAFMPSTTYRGTITYTLYDNAE